MDKKEKVVNIKGKNKLKEDSLKTKQEPVQADLTSEAEKRENRKKVIELNEKLNQFKSLRTDKIITMVYFDKKIDYTYNENGVAFNKASVMSLTRVPNKVEFTHDNGSCHLQVHLNMGTLDYKIIVVPLSNIQNFVIENVLKEKQHLVQIDDYINKIEKEIEELKIKGDKNV